MQTSSRTNSHHNGRLQTLTLARIDKLLRGELIANGPLRARGKQHVNACHTDPKTDTDVLAEQHPHLGCMQ
jgi:hypothetical protein